jgi:hypothetical protein
VALVQKSAFALFGDFTCSVKHMRFPTQTRGSPHFRASTRAIVKQFLVDAHLGALRQRTCHSTIWRTAEENAYVEGFQSIQADGFAGEQFIRISGTIP